MCMQMILKYIYSLYERGGDPNTQCRVLNACHDAGSCLGRGSRYSKNAY